MSTSISIEQPRKPWTRSTDTHLQSWKLPNTKLHNLGEVEQNGKYNQLSKIRIVKEMNSFLKKQLLFAPKFN
jgi:hypothetical protein